MDYHQRFSSDSHETSHLSLNGASLELGIVMGRLLDRSDRSIVLQEKMVSALERIEDKLGRSTPEGNRLLETTERIQAILRAGLPVISYALAAYLFVKTGSLEYALNFVLKLQGLLK